MRVSASFPAAEATTLRASSESAQRPVILADGTLEALKWLAAVVMVLDHTNKFFFAESMGVVFAAGRVVMPVFGFVLAYNLARPQALARGVHRRMLVRLGITALIATPIVIALNHGVVEHNAWWPLNILFTLWVVVAMVALMEQGGWARYLLAALLFLVAGAFIEYLWFGLLTCLGAYGYCRDRSAPRLLGLFLGVLSLTVINGNAWALMALPLIALGCRLHLQLPRSKWFFYAFYPAHLAVLLLVKATS